MALVSPGVCLSQGLVIEGCRLDWFGLGACTESGHRELQSCLPAGDRPIPMEQGCIFRNWSGIFSCPGSRLVQTSPRSSDRCQHSETLEDRITPAPLAALSWEHRAPPRCAESCPSPGARSVLPAHRDPGGSTQHQLLLLLLPCQAHLPHKLSFEFRKEMREISFSCFRARRIMGSLFPVIKLIFVWV